MYSDDTYVLIKLACHFWSGHEAILTDGYDYRPARESRVVFPKGDKSGVKSLLPFWLHIWGSQEWNPSVIFAEGDPNVFFNDMIALMT